MITGFQATLYSVSFSYGLGKLYKSLFVLCIVYGRVFDRLRKMFILAFFRSRFRAPNKSQGFKYVTNFWINKRAFIIFFQNLNSISGYRDI